MHFFACNHLFLKKLILTFSNSFQPALPSHVITTSAEAPSRQEVIAAQTADEKSQQRNRRMFSALVGTLQKFRKEETRVRERV